MLLGGTQQMPGHRVGIPGSGGHHHPYVGSGDQLGGEAAAVGDERVDVGRVEEGESAGQGVRGLDPQGAFGFLTAPAAVAVRRQVVVVVVAVPLAALRGLLRGHPHAGQVGQDAHPGEPVMIIRMADEHRRTRRGPQHARLADLPADERVHQGGLACPGGPADDGEQRRFGRLEPGHQIVVELCEQLVPVGTRAWRPRQGERKACGGDTLAQGGECVKQLRPYVQGHHMRRMPNFDGFLKHMRASARRSDTTEGRDGGGAGITSAQHPWREAPKAMRDSHLPAIIRTASPNLHIAARRRSTRDRDPGALSLSPARSRISPTSEPTPPGHTRPP